ncbi:MAG: putative bifunctional diguanylate cyclase/phosphodiesterase [Prochloraceae cyanobacterium]
MFGETAKQLACSSPSELLFLMERAITFCRNGIVIVDANRPDLPIILVNPALEKLTGYAAAEILGRNCRFLQGNDRNQPEIEQMRTAILQAQECQVILRNYRPDGTMFWNEVYISPVFNHKKELTHFIGIQTDVTERKQAEKQLQQLAFYDSLTSLPNRTYFLHKLEQAVEKIAEQPNYLFAVLFIDLDDFKLVNDSFGHTIGDRLLIALARRLEASLGSSDLVARLGGDEFIILLPKISALDDVVQVAEKIHQQLEFPFQLDGYEVFTSASMGISLGTTECLDPQELLRNADLAMYHAKVKGKGKYALFDRQMHKLARARLQIETDLRRAQLRSEFEIYYQPIFSLTTGNITGFEALVRWQHPEKGFISPGEFIPVAEVTGLIVPLGQWVLYSACSQMKIWQQQFPQTEPLRIGVNVSSQQLQQADFLDQLDRNLAATGLDSRYLQLELTESILMENTESMRKTLSLLRSREIELSLDDFGTGYSSLSYLQSFPLNTLKIDRSFIKSISFNQKNPAIVGAIITLAQTLDLDVIAEGIETSRQLELLKMLGCSQGQGYLFAQPMSVKDVERFLVKS